jgi:anti-sigma B factor antagonist
MQIEVKSLKKVDVIALAGRIDSSNATDFDNAMKDLLSKGRRNIVLDMSKLDYMSSAGLRAMVAALKSARNGGGNVVIAEPNERMVDTLKLVGFQSLFTQYPHVLDAVDSF